jgi:hypothetical protein
MTQMSGSVSLDMRRLIEAVRTAVRDELAYPVLLTPEDAALVLHANAPAGNTPQAVAEFIAEALHREGYALVAVRTDLRDWYADRYEERESAPPETTTENLVNHRGEVVREVEVPTPGGTL